MTPREKALEDALEEIVERLDRVYYRGHESMVGAVQAARAALALPRGEERPWSDAWSRDYVGQVCPLPGLLRHAISVIASLGDSPLLRDMRATVAVLSSCATVEEQVRQAQRMLDSTRAGKGKENDDG